MIIISIFMIISRFAPSPTGLLHIGNIRIALLNWIYTKSFNGKFILRIDDTDKDRSNKNFEDKIIEDLIWLGIEWDLFFRQSERNNRYLDIKEELIRSGYLYPCFETKDELINERNMLRKNGKPPIYIRKYISNNKKNELISLGIKPYWRFKIDYDEDIIWNDMIRGEIKIDPKTISDPILFKENGDPTYTICTVVDDMDHNITNIIRGEDHLTNSATHIKIFSALGVKNYPKLAHIPLVYNKETDISKRSGGGFDIKSLRESGIESMVINSMMALIGTSYDIKPYKNISDLFMISDLNKISKSRILYNRNDLDILNEKYIKSLSYNEIKKRFNNIPEFTHDFWEFIKNNIKNINEVDEWLKICNKKVFLYSPKDKEEKIFLDLCASLLPEGIPDKSTWNIWMEKIKKFSDRSGKNLFMPLRLSLSGKDKGPEMKILISFMSRDLIIYRLRLF
ncbi:glutamate--tRNA ligase [Lyticum sinuosum]|uniref:Glutamate--tRNA ligase n=1 Tax=Lyticum sinuosum TaxID=1332059 RepID=A0AAE4VKN1_9RICK|nr:glutamate--tRNA ligase [Lyticum sinuosum]MDZ5761009.1 Glutamate--tRNA ligase [Lyticum sinuosum]